MWVLNTRSGAIPKAVCLWDMIFYLGCLVWSQWERTHLAPQKRVVPKGSFHPLRGKAEEVAGKDWGLGSERWGWEV